MKQRKKKKWNRKNNIKKRKEKVKVKVKQSLYRPGQATWEFRDVKAPRFQDSRQMMVVRLSALSTGRLYPQEIFLVFTYVRCWGDPRTIVRPEGLRQWHYQEPNPRPSGCSAVPQPTAPPGASIKKRKQYTNNYSTVTNCLFRAV